MAYWQEQYESMPRDRLEELQLSRLEDTLKRASSSPFYQKRFKQAGLAPSDIRSLGDLAKIPFTTKDDLRAAWDYGMWTLPRKKAVRLHSSSGTTGRATVIYHTRKDIDAWADLMARCITATGAGEGDVLQNMIGYGLFTGGLGMHYGAEKAGLLVIPSGPGNTKRQIEMMRDYRTTVTHSTPSYALHVAEVFAELGLDPEKDVDWRIAYVGAEPHSEEVRKKIERELSVTTYNSYGLSEMNGPGVAFECEKQDGMHLWEDAYLLEVVDPETLEPVPDGTVGEIVLTTLAREGMPILRYRTRDLGRVLTGNCPCGRTHRRLDRIKGRSDDMLIVRGVNLYPSQVEDVLMTFPEVGSTYQIHLTRRGTMDELTVKVELAEAMFAGDVKNLSALKKRMIAALAGDIIVKPKIEFLEPGSLPRSAGKAVRVVDERNV